MGTRRVGSDTTTPVPSPRTSTGGRPATSARSEAAASTRHDLVRAATELFTQDGYAGTSLESVVSTAGVTKGALYHHFGSKQDLFAAVLQEAQQQLVDDVLARLPQDGRPPFEGALRTVLEATQSPLYQQVVLRDGPAVLGVTAQDPARHPGFPAVVDLLRTTLGPDWGISPAELDALARLLLGALVAAATQISRVDDPQDEMVRAERGLMLVLASLREAATAHPDLSSVISGS